MEKHLRTYNSPAVVIVNQTTSKIISKNQHRKLLRIWLMLFLSYCFGAKSFAQTPSLSYNSPQVYSTGTAITPLTPTSSNVSVSGFGAQSTYYTGSYGLAMVVDPSGNIFTNISNGLSKIPAGGGTAVAITTGLTSVTGVATDAAGNVYLADRNTGTITEITNPGQPGSVQTTLINGLSNLVSVAVGATGNIYTLKTNPTNLLSEYPVSGGVAGAKVVMVSGFNGPQSIAVDNTGDVYVVGTTQSSVIEVPATSTSYPLLSYNLPTLGTGVFQPVTVAVDNAGNVFVCNFNNSSPAILKIDAGGNTTTISGAGIGSFSTCAVDIVHDAVFYTNQGNIFEVKRNGGYYISPGLPTGLSLDANSGIISGTPTAPSPAANYTITGYNSTSNSSTPASLNITVDDNLLTTLALSSGTLSPVFSASTNSYSAQVVHLSSINVTLTPDNPAVAVTYNGTTITPGTPFPVTGLNIGSINSLPIVVTSGDGSSSTYTIALNDLSGPTVSYNTPNVYVTGTAIAPLTPVSNSVSAPSYGTPAVFYTAGNFFPSPIALDAAGNVYVGNAAFGVVQKIPTGGGTAISIATPGLNTVYGLAFDKSGNLYLADNNTGTITEITNPGQPNSTQTTLVSGLVNAGGVAVDTAGNIYATEINGNHQVYKYTMAGGVVTSTTTIGGGFIDPTGIAVDGLGNVYIADRNQTSIKEIPVSNTQYPVDISNMLSVGSGFVSPGGVAIDNGGNVLVANYSSLGVQRVDISGAITTLSSTVSDPYGVAIDPSGNVYYTDTNGETVTKVTLNGGFYISPALPGGLIFNNTTGIISGTPAVSSPATNYTVSAYNSSTGASASTTVNIKVASNNANLAGLAVSAGSFSPVFAAANTSYNVTVSNATTSITVTPTTSDAGASVTVNGTAVTSGTASLSQPLSVGITTIPVVVTASDGVTIITYNLLVNRASIPAVSYNSPNVYAVGTAITPLTPTSSNVSGISYSAAPTTVFNSGGFPGALAVDAAGDLYIGSQGSLDMLPAGGGASVNIRADFSYIGGIAVDASGNVYVSDFGAGTVSELTAPVQPGSVANTLISGLNGPDGLFVDAAGSIYVTETNNADVLKYPVVGGVVGAKIIITNAVSSAVGVALDNAGNIYIADSQNPSILKVPASVTTYPAASGSLVPVGSGFSFPSGVAVDNTGAVYVTDLSVSTVSRVDATGAITIIASGLQNPSAVGVDGIGNVYVANTNGSDVLEIPQTGGYYIIPALPAGLTINSSTGVISGTPAVASAATIYTVLAYNGGGDKTTTTVSIQTNTVTPTISYNSPNVYPTGTAITPLAPTSTNVSAFGYGAQTSLYTTATNNTGSVTTDKAGNIYTTNGSQVLEIPAGGGAVITIAHGFSVAVGVAVDGLGHIYVTDEAGGKLYKIVNPGTSSTDSLMETGLKSPIGLAVDVAGNLYMIENNGGSGRDLKKYTVVNTKVTATTTIANVATSGLNSPSGVAVDGSGNIYIADVGRTNILKIPSTVTTYPVTAANTLSVGSGFSFPNFVAVDNAGDVFVSDGGNVAIKRVDAGTGNITTINNGTALSEPSGVALDATGNVYYTDNVSNNALEVYEVKQTGGYNISPALPAGLGLDNNTGIISGTPTFGSPATNYTITAINGPSNTSASAVVSIQTVNVNLSNLVVTPGTLSPVFSGTVNSYSATVTTATATVTPTLSDPTASVTVNGATVTSGTASASIPLNIGANVVTIVVTGSDHVTIQTYSLTINRPPPPTLAYAGPYVYNTGTAITPVVPVSSSVAILAYAPQATFVSSVATATTPAISLPTGIAADLSGNLFLANWTGSNGPGVVERVPTGTPATYGSGFQQPYNLATDAGGNVYVADIALTSIKKITPGNVVTSIGSGLNFPTGTAVDAAGNVYVSEAGNDDVVKITPAGVKTVLATGFSSPNDVALDAAGNLYIADGVASSIYILQAGTATPVVGTTLPTIGTGFFGTNGVAVDGSGNVFVATGNNTLVEISNTGVQRTLASGVSIFGVATDGAGNAYESDNAGAKIYIVKPLGGYFISPALPAGLNFNNNTGVISGIPTAGTPATNYTITAYNTAGASVSSTVNIKTISGNAALSNITLSSGTVSPSVVTGTFAYTASVITPTIAVTPTTADITATVTVNSTPVTSGLPSANIPLTLGSNTINMVVTAGDGTTTQAYTLTVNRGEGLTNLVLSSATLSPAFATTTTSYTASTEFSSINVTPTTPDPAAIVTVNGTTVASGSPISVGLTVGSNTITTLVTSADASVSQTYTTTVTYTQSAVSSLSRLTINSGSVSPSFRATTLTYTATSGTKLFTITPTATDATATIKINGTTATSATAFPVTLTSGSNVFNIVVTAAAGGTTTYKLTVTYTPSSTLSGLSINSGSLSPSFSASKVTYTATSTMPAFTITPTATDGAATITVNGTTVTSGTAQAITLTSGPNVINTVVTTTGASPASTTYRLTVTYTPSTVTTLKALTIDQGTLNPNFAAATTGYTASVANSVTAINVTPTLTFSGATLTVNTTAATSGSAFNVPLNTGANTITIVVTAQDGTHTGTYTLVVTRAKSAVSTLSNLTLSNATLNPGFASGNIAYTASEPSGTTSALLTATTTDAGSTITVNTIAATSGTPVSVPLVTGDNTITTMVTSEDGSTNNTYTIVVNVSLPTTTIISISPATASVTNAASVDYTVVFGQAVTGLSTTNFSLAPTGAVSGASVTSLSGSGTTYDVTVNTGAGDGTLGLNLANGSGISYTITNLPFAGDIYYIDKTAPTVSSVSVPANATYIAGQNLDFTVNFSEAVSISGTPQIPVTIGSSVVNASYLPGSGTNIIVFRYTVQAGDNDSDGIAVGSAITLNGGIIADVAINNAVPTLNTVANTTGVLVDTQAPSVSSITATTPANTNPTNATSVTYTVTFSEPVTGVTSNAFAATTSGVTTTGINVSAVSASVYSVTVNGISGSGTLRLDLNSSGTGITDLATNPISGGFTTGDVYTIDQTAPVVSSITATAPSNTNPTNATSVTYTVTFSKPVTGVTSSGFTTTTSGVTATGINVSSVSSSVYSVTVSGISGTGTLRLDLNASGTGITDLVGNPVSGGFTGGDVYNIDQSLPLLVNTAYYTNNANISWAKVGDQITLNTIFNKQVNTPAITIGGHTVTPVNTSGNTWVSTYTLTSSDAEGQVSFDINITDLAGNTNEYTSTREGLFVSFDKTAPTATISAPSVTSISTGSPNSVSYAVTYSDLNFKNSNLTGSAITLSTTGAANGTIGVTGSGASYTVSISGITGVGTIAINLAGGYAFDQAGNTDIGAGLSAPFTVLNNDATLSNLAISNGTLTPAFSPAVTTYAATVGYGLANISITPTVHDPNATVKVNGTAAISGSATVVPLSAGSTAIPVIVTAQDGSTQQNIITITTARSGNNSLASVKTSAGLAQGATVPATLTESVVNSIASLTVTPAVADPTASVTVNNVAVASGQPSASIPLNVGANTITIVVTAQNTQTKTYTLTVTRAPSANTKLSNLVVSNGTLSPAFGTATNYLDYIANGTTLSVTPTLSDPTATLTINGTPATSGTATAVPLVVGNNTITVVVTAQDNTSTKTYTIVVNEAKSPNNTLFSLVTSGGLSQGQTVQTTLMESVPNATSSITVTPTMADNTATVKVNNVAVISGQSSAGIPLNVGNNTITIIGTAQNGTTLTYTLTVTRAASSLLSGLTATAGTLSPAFASTTSTYSILAPNGTTATTITPTAAGPGAIILVNGNAVSSGTASPSIPLPVGNSSITVTVTAADNSNTTTYTVNVNVARSPNNTLASLVTSGGFSQGQTVPTTLTESVPNSTSSITVTPTMADNTATVTVNNVAVTSGQPSAGIPLNVGTNAITIVGTAQNGSALTYTLTVTRAASSLLSGLTASAGALNPGFVPATTTYAIYAPNGTTSTSITPTADPGATIQVNGATVNSGSASPTIPLTVGNTNITIAVTAADNSTTTTYTVGINVARSPNNTLASLTTSGGFSQGQTVPTTLSESVPNGTSSITVTPTMADNTATVTVNNVTVTSGQPSASILLNVGTNIIAIIGTAQNGSTLTYTLTVTRAASPTLSSLALSSGTLSPAFAPATISYTSSVTSGVNSITLTPTATDPAATIKVNGSTVASGSISPAIPLVAGNTTITVAVTAADNSSTITYTLRVNRARSPDDVLFSLKTSAGLAKGKTVPTTLTESVVNAVSSLTVTPTVDDATATVTVNNVAVTSGAASASIPLIVGNNTITVVVTAQNGATLTYTLTVTRAIGSVNTVYEPVSVDKPTKEVQIADDGINIHQAISPNGDGINDFLQIDNISQYPDNNLKVMNRNGQLVFEAKGYDNANKVFDGHSNKNGQMQLPGTYFYELDYTVNGVSKHKTGYLILKY